MVGVDVLSAVFVGILVVASLKGFSGIREFVQFEFAESFVIPEPAELGAKKLGSATIKSLGGLG